MRRRSDGQIEQMPEDGEYLDFAQRVIPFIMDTKKPIAQLVTQSCNGLKNRDVPEDSFFDFARHSESGR
jgi:hypothetical protein